MTTNSNIDSINNFETYVNSVYYKYVPNTSGTGIATSLQNYIQSNFIYIAPSNLAYQGSNGYAYGRIDPTAAIVTSSTGPVAIKYMDNGLFSNTGGISSALYPTLVGNSPDKLLVANEFANIINYIQNKATFKNFPSNFPTADTYFTALIAGIFETSEPIPNPPTVQEWQKFTVDVPTFLTWVNDNAPFLLYTGMVAGDPSYSAPQNPDTFSAVFSSFLQHYSGVSTGDITPLDFFNAYLAYIRSPAFIQQNALTGVITGSFTPNQGLALSINIGTAANPNYVQVRSTGSGDLGRTSNVDVGTLTPVTLPDVIGFSLAGNSQLIDAFYNSFLTAMSAENGDNPHLPSITSQANFNNTFTQFITYYLDNRNLSNLGLTGTTSIASDFFNQWQTFLTATSLMQSTSTSATNPLASINQYQVMYAAFFPGNSSAQFYNDLNSFIQGKFGGTTPASADNYFNPSHDVDDYFSHLLAQYKGINGIPTSKSTLEDANFDAVKILFSVFNLLVQLIQDLQNLTTAEANYLKFFANYQKAYTDLMAQIPVFSPTTPQLVGTDAYTTRVVQDLATLNSSHTSNLQAYRDIQSSRAQQVQSQLTQSNQNVNQQANIATQILQEFSTILQSIFPH